MISSDTMPNSVPTGSGNSFATVLIATGTSGLDLVKLSAKMKDPARFVGIHYFMPADTTPIVEVMAGPSTPRSGNEG